MQEWVRNKAKIGQEDVPAKMTKAKHLITRTTAKDLEEEAREKQEPQRKKKKFKYDAPDYQGHDLFTLGGTASKMKKTSLHERLMNFTFAERPRGVIVMVLGNLQITDGKDG